MILVWELIDSIIMQTHLAYDIAFQYLTKVLFDVYSFDVRF